MAEELIIKIGAESDQFSKELDKLTKETRNLEKQLKNVAAISGLAFAGLAAGIGLAVNEFAKFENSLLGVKTLLDEASFGSKGLEEGFNDMRKAALNLANELPIDVDKVNKALFDTVSAGIDASKAVGVVAISAKLAVSGLTDVAIATDGITSALNAYGKSAEEANDVAGAFFTAQKFGKTTIEQLSRGFGLVASTARNTGVRFEELLAAVSAATIGGIRTRQAYSGLSAILANIAKPTKEAAEEAQRLGIEFNLQSLQAQGLSGFLKSVSEAEGFTAQSAVNLFGSIEAVKVAFALTGSQAKDFQRILNELDDKQKVSATFTRAFEEQQASLQNQFVKLKGSIQVALIQLGTEFAPVIQAVTKAFSGLVALFNANPIFIKITAVVIGLTAAITGLITAIAILALGYIKLNNVIVASNISMIISGKIYKLQTFLSTALHKANLILALGFKLVGRAIRLMLGPWGILIAVITLLASAYRKEIQQGVQIAIQTFANIWSAAVEIAILSWNDFTDRIANFRILVSAVFSSVARIVESFADIFTSTITGLGDVLRGIIDFDPELIKKGLDQLREGVVEEFGRIGEEANKAFNDELAKGVEERAMLLQEAAFVGPRLPEGFEPPTDKPDEDLKNIRLEQRKIENQQILLEDQKLSKELTDLKKEEIALRKSLEEEEGTATKAALMRRIEENQSAQRENIEREVAILADARDNKIISEQEFNELQDEMRTEREEERREILLEELMTEQEIRNEAADEQLTKQIETQNELIRNQQKFGIAFAEINKIINSDQVQGAKTAAGELVALQRSSNNTLKTIGKIAAVADITIRTATSAMRIYEGFSTIPIIGPALGIAGAAAAIAFGAEQISKVGGAAHGGVATGGIAGVDSIPFMLSPGELIAPAQNFDEVVGAVADKRIAEDTEGEGLQSPGSAVVEIRLAGDFMDVIEAELVERTNLDIGITKVGAI